MVPGPESSAGAPPPPPNTAEPPRRGDTRRRRGGKPGGPKQPGRPLRPSAHVADAPEPSLSPLYKTRMCQFYLEGLCGKGALCPYAHGEEDLRASPDFERTSVCPVMLGRGQCTRPGCRYAHKSEELRVAPGLLKTKMCSFFLKGLCVVGEACRFAHGEDELREALDVQKKAEERAPAYNHSEEVVLDREKRRMAFFSGANVNIKGNEASASAMSFGATSMTVDAAGVVSFSSGGQRSRRWGKADEAAAAPEGAAAAHHETPADLQTGDAPAPQTCNLICKDMASEEVGRGVSDASTAQEVAFPEDERHHQGLAVLIRAAEAQRATVVVAQDSQKQNSATAKRSESEAAPKDEVAETKVDKEQALRCQASPAKPKQPVLIVAASDPQCGVSMDKTVIPPWRKTANPIAERQPGRVLVQTDMDADILDEFSAEPASVALSEAMAGPAARKTSSAAEAKDAQSTSPPKRQAPQQPARVRLLDIEDSSILLEMCPSAVSKEDGRKTGKKGVRRARGAASDCPVAGKASSSCEAAGCPAAAAGTDCPAATAADCPVAKAVQATAAVASCSGAGSQACALCPRFCAGSETRLESCLACNAGVKVITRNTFIDVSYEDEEDDDSDSDREGRAQARGKPGKRSKSL
eukprot:TRINITY_DN14422_c0_g1_i1.p1 TRINITY_DN14422_c0_g1~~TRINITY_DN14422_c0_g1_i1.p1  ORF type:complete len:639 (+),score=138.54 TRINITY_DN14422_c0_g1_i1:80-1996(+)